MKQFPFPLRFSIPGIILIFGCLLGLFSFNQEVSQSYRRTEEDGIHEARFYGNQISWMLDYLIRQGDLAQAKLFIGNLGGNPNLNWTILIDENNAIIAANRFELRGRSLSLTPLANKLPDVEKVRQILSGQVMLSQDRQRIWAIYPVRLASAPDEIRSSRVGVLLLEYDLSGAKNRAYTDGLVRSLEYTAVLALFGAIAWYLFDRILTKRAGRLVAVSKNISQGNLSDRVLMKGSDELAQIAISFDRMADQIQANTEAILESEARFRSLVTNIPGAVYRCLYNNDSKMLFISDAIAEITGYDAADFIHNRVISFASIIHPEDRKIVDKAVAIAVANQQHYVIDYRIIRADGSIRWVYEKGQGVFDQKSKLMWLNGAIFDISDRKQAEAELHRTLQQKEKLALAATVQAQQLEQTLKDLQKAQAQIIQAEKMSSLGQLVAGVAHEINNPVSFIYGNLNPAEEYIQNLLALINLYQEGYTNSTPEIKQLIENIDLEFLIDDLPKLLSSMKVGADRIREIILTLRNFARLDEAKMKCVNIHDGIDSSLLILQSRLKGTHKQPSIEVVKHYDELPLVECYPGQLNQVFMNILINAIDAIYQDNNDRYVKGLIAKSSKITIETYLLDDDWVCVRIKDNGSGIDSSIKSKLFDPFFTTKPVGKGSGIGLSISYEIIVHQHGGVLECLSEVGTYTEFVISIPIKQNFNVKLAPIHQLNHQNVRV